MRSEIGRMTLEKTFEEQDTLSQAVVRIVIEAARAWSIECLQHEIQDTIPLASIQQAMEMQTKAEPCRSEGDQQSEINLVPRRSTRLGRC